MGSLFYTFTEAANRLGCSKRTIHNYVKRGYLRKSFHDGHVVLNREDVEQLANESGADLPALNRKNFAILMRRVLKLEQDMALCRRILEIRDDPLRPTADEAKMLYAAASKALAAGVWKDEEIESWATDVFDRLDEVSLDMLKESLGLEHPYEVFFKLCLAQMKSVSTREDFKSSLPLQILHKKLDEGRKKMRATLLMWHQVSKTPVSDSLLEKFESEKGTLFKKLSGATSK
jgi:excisionase family DNA binding protein